MIFSRKQKSKFLIGIFTDEHAVLNATKAVTQNKVPIYDVFTPYPVHGIDDAMGIKRTRLPVVTFIMGLIGFLLAFGFQMWVFTQAWPINIGGKPFASIPAFIPVTFEFTVLIGGLATVAALFCRERFFPGKKPLVFDEGVTNDRFVIALEQNDATVDYQKVAQFLKNQGAIQVKECEV